MKKRNYSIPKNRYERYLNELRDRTCNCINKTVWDYTLYKFGRVRFGKSVVDDESVNDENIVDESTTDVPVNDDKPTKI